MIPPGRGGEGVNESATGFRPATDGAPLYQQIKAWIRATIAAGEFAPDEPFTTEKQLRERFGVSNATAVRALNDLVNEGLLVRKRARGTFVAEREPVQPAKAGGRGRNVAYIAAGHGGAHQSSLMQGINAVCVELGYRLFVTDTSDGSDHERRAIEDAIENGADGVLWYPRDDAGETDALDELERHQIPVVFVDRYLPSSPADAVLADNFAVGQLVTSELIKLGHQRMATFWEETRCTSVRDRLSGHVQTLRDHSLPVQAEFTALRPYMVGNADSRRARLRSLLERADAPSVVVCANGFLLAHVVHDLVAMGVRVPEDIDVASMDDAGPFNLMPLASVAVHLPSREMGETAMRRLAQKAASGEAASGEHVVFPVELRTRSESGIYLRPIRTEDADVVGSV